jgi:hypothetical protein
VIARTDDDSPAAGGEDGRCHDRCFPRSVGDDLLAAAFSGRPASQLPIAIVSSGVGEMLRARAAAERRAKR